MIFFFNDTATTEIYTLSLHDALPILLHRRIPSRSSCSPPFTSLLVRPQRRRSEEHTSELQSPCNLVCRLLLEKKNWYRHAALSGPSARREQVGPPASGAPQTA